MNAKHEIEHQQATLWNGVAGRAWVDTQEVLDGMYEPFERMLVEAVRQSSASRVLDVGCGTGSTTLAVARLLGAKGRCIGVDVSGPMIEAARARAEQDGMQASFIRADAQSYPFEASSFDMIISRFGVMFFGEPVEAFRNVRRAATDAAELRFVAWRSAADNPFMTTAERAAASLLPNVPPRQPGAPGQFAFANSDRVQTILNESGWTAIEVRPVDVECAFPEKELVGYFTRLGPVGLVLQEADESIRAQVIETVRVAFEPYVHGDEVRFTAACWMVSAKAARPGR